MSILSPQFDWQIGSFAAKDSSLLAECSALFSKNYGTWSLFHPVLNFRGKNVRLLPGKIAELLQMDNAVIVTARHGDYLIGYAIVLLLPFEKQTITWTTQLVVSQNFRRNRVAHNLLSAACRLSDSVANGLITANPYAVRALEGATGRRCDPSQIKQNKKILPRLQNAGVFYVNPGQEIQLDSSTSAINTEFFVDHSDVPMMIEQVTDHEVPWRLGQIQEGWEWLAFSFCETP